MKCHVTIPQRISTANPFSSLARSASLVQERRERDQTIGNNIHTSYNDEPLSNYIEQTYNERKQNTHTESTNKRRRDHTYQSDTFHFVVWHTGFAPRSEREWFFFKHPIQRQPKINSAIPVSSSRNLSRKKFIFRNHISRLVSEDYEMSRNIT
jgi:hypothetical protein